MSECTDGLGADVGTQLERVNQHCVTGFPDVHMMLIMTELNGTLEAETINPESEEKMECRVEVEDKTRVRMTEYLSDYFTDETYLTDALALGPTATNIGVTPAMQFYGGGLYYNPEECRVSINDMLTCYYENSSRTTSMRTFLRTALRTDLAECHTLVSRWRHLRARSGHTSC